MSEMNYLHVVQDGQVVSTDRASLFDSEKFDEIIAVTCVSSPTLFLEATKAFSSVHLILGVEDREHQQSFLDGWSKLADPKERARFWNQLDVATKEKIQDGSCTIRYGEPGYAIHSKIYLLRHSKTGECRLILGSANFTSSGFGAGKQFEEICVFDQHPLYDVYLKRVNTIRNHTLDYIPEFVRKEKKPEETFSVQDPDVLAGWMIKEAAEFRERKIALTEESWEAFQNLPQELELQKRESNKQVQLLKLVMQKDARNKKMKPATVKMLEKKRNHIAARMTKKHPEQEGLDHRPPILFDPTRSQLYLKAEPEEGETDPQRIPYSHPADLETIREQLTLIHEFIDAYHWFTVEKNEGNQKRIFETILYGFLSPYIWKIREHYATTEGSDSARSIFPPFLILGGRAMHGKTTVIELLGIIMGHQPHYRNYEAFPSEKALQRSFETDWVMPLLIDEVPNRFFSGTRGEQLIKFAGNQLVGNHPCMIGTTNATGFHSSHQNMRRLYYLEINNTFRRDQLVESRRYLTEIQSKLNASLFKDFTHRVGKRLKEEKRFYTLGDPLYLAREIFLEYYNETGIRIPQYFPYQVFRDYEERGREIWRNLYRQFGEHFVPLEEDVDRMFVDIQKFSNGQKDREQKIHLLPVECIAEDHNLLLLKTDAFFQYIQMKKPKVKKGLFHQLASLIGNRK